MGLINVKYSEKFERKTSFNQHRVSNSHVSFLFLFLLTTSHRKVKGMKVLPCGSRKQLPFLLKGLFKTCRVWNLGQYLIQDLAHPSTKLCQENFTLEFKLYICVTACFDFSYIVPVVVCGQKAESQVTEWFLAH